jgi:hypothetical protein
VFQEALPDFFTFVDFRFRFCHDTTPIGEGRVGLPLDCMRSGVFHSSRPDMTKGRRMAVSCGLVGIHRCSNSPLKKAT